MKVKGLCLVSACSCACLLVASIASAANLIVDPSFELGTPSGPENTGGWSFFNGANVNTNPANANTGNNSVDMVIGGVPGSFETFNIGVTGGAQFTLTGFGKSTTAITGGFAGVQATFFSGDNASGANLGTVESGAGNAKFSNQINNTSPVGVEIPLTTGIFTAPAGAQSMQAFALGVNLAGSPVFIDDLNLQQVVPEPATLSLLGLGLVGFGLVARRRFR